MMIGVIAHAFLVASEEQRADRNAKAYAIASASAEPKKFLPSEMDGHTAAEAESQLTETQNPLRNDSKGAIIVQCRGGRIRTCDLLLPKQTR